MSSATINKQSFQLILNRTKRFTLKMANFAVTTALAVLIRISTINLSVIVRQLLRNLITLRISTVAISSLAKFRTRIPTTLLAGKIGVSTILKTINRMLITMTSKIALSFITRFLSRIPLSMTTGKIGMAFSVVVAILIKLSALDPQLLSALDGLSLSQMDHS